MTLKTYELTINRTLPATPEEVYDAWLDPKIPCNPWHGSNRLEWTPKQGNLWYFLHIMSGEKAQPPSSARTSAASASSTGRARSCSTGCRTTRAAWSPSSP